MNALALEFREGGEEDAAAIQALLYATIPMVIANPEDPAAAVFMESLGLPAIKARLGDPRYRNLVATRHGKLVGYIATRDDSHIYHLFVDPALHRQGIARALWNELLRRRGNGPCTVNASPAAVPVYRAFGFLEDGNPQLHRCPPFVPMRFGGDA